MKKSIPILLLALIPLFSSYKSPEIKEPDPIIIKIPAISRSKVLLFSEVFESMKVVPLETKASSVIGAIDKIIYSNDRIFILDPDGSKKVLEFDDKGKFIDQIGRYGKGPGEYDQPDDISFDWIGKKIILYVKSKKALLYFDLNGKFIKEVPLNIYFSNFSFISENRYAVYMDNDINSSLPDNPRSNFIVLNNKCEIEFSAFPFNHEKDKRRMGNTFLSATDSSLLVLPGYTGSVYSYQAKKLTLKYKFDFGEHNLPESYLNGTGEDVFYKELRKTNYAYVNSILETPDCLVFTFVYKSAVYTGFYSFRTKQTKYGSMIINDLNGLMGGARVWTAIYRGVRD